MSKKEKIGYLAGITAIVIMGFSFYFSKIALNELNNQVFSLLSYRFTVSILGVFLLERLRLIKLDYKGKNIKKLIGLCLVQPVAYFIFETIGLSMVSSSEAGLMMALLPVITIIMGMIILGERISLIQGIFIAISIGGALFINLMGYEPGDSSNLGRIIFLMAVILGAWHGVLLREASEEFSSMERAAAMMATGAIAFISIALVQNLIRGTVKDYLLGIFNIKLLFPLLFLGLASAVLAMFLLNTAYTYLEVKKVSVISNSMIIVTIFAGVVLLKESFYWYHIVGSLLIIVGAIGVSIFDDAKDVSQGDEQREHNYCDQDNCNLGYGDDR